MFKFLSLFSVLGMFIIAPAFAEDLPACINPDDLPECVGSHVSGMQYKSNAPIKADYAIYFGTGLSEICPRCKQDVDNIIAELESQAQDIETVLLFGSADTQGKSNSYDNSSLTLERVQTVNKLLEGKVTTCEVDENGKVTNQRCAVAIMGHSPLDALAEVDLDDYRARAVFMFVIYKQDICNKKVRQTLEYLSGLSNDRYKTNASPSVTDIKNALNSAQNLCPDNDTLLFRSQREDIDSAIANAVINLTQEGLTEVQNADVVDNTILIKAYAQGINTARSALLIEKSVWKDQDGNFNYARLASDSIAGVVLGTAGGLITSHVVKKNQLTKGFENIMCTIGGQSVAQYGDEFQVGIKTK